MERFTWKAYVLPGMLDKHYTNNIILIVIVIFKHRISFNNIINIRMNPCMY